MSLHDLIVAATVLFSVFVFGNLLNRGKFQGYGYEVAIIIAALLVVWAFLSRQGYFGIVHYALH